ncbi:glycosyltransferase family 4 protein [Desulfallas sp. Bu1-1]|uniref:glycosyltransferase family 4 protein n=1 Tax=Desulfallas sp. Bu1-1 TaxID=2787620 RepID=UPI0018A09CF3|nr:glycosyltransferase family 4 protein [Desulfallas sp. Bu1-1]MBF7081406.1 glycosyltransferase family 4 protein [Desulfallas sp. Bu1-1]
MSAGGRVAVKICILTSVHRPFDTRIFYREAKTLAGAGYETVLVAPHDRDEVVEGVRIRAVPQPGGRRARLTRTVWRVYRAAAAENADIYHFHDPELVPAGLMLKLRGKRVVYDVHEHVPRQILNKDWIPKWFRGMAAGAARVMEASAARLLDGIVAATPTIAEQFPVSKTVLVQNFPSPGELAAPRRVEYSERPPLIAYVGVIGVIRAIREMVEAVALLPETINARLVLAGNFNPPGLENELRDVPGWEKVEFWGWQSRAQVAEILGRVRVGLVMGYPTPNNLNGYPNKLFEYMSAGLPVIASDFPLWRSIIEDAGCGVVVDPLDPRSIARAMQWLLENPGEAEAMGKRGQEAVSAKYNWDAEARKLLQFYENLSNGPGREATTKLMTK